MAIVSISLNTTDRQAVLTINGVLVPSDEFNISKYKKYDTGEIELSFGYTIESVGNDGLTERRQFFLPSSEEIAAEVHGELNDDGFVSKMVYDDEKAKADTIAFIKQGRNS